MNLKLSTRITLLAALPFAAFFVLAASGLRGDWTTSRQAASMSANGLLFKAASKLIHEQQKERGMTALFLADAASLPELERQRARVDQAHTGFGTARAEAALNDQEHLQASKEALSSLSGLRDAVNAKTAPDALQRYTVIIGTLLNLQRTIARESRLNGLDTLMTSMTVLELAKENMGRLRAIGSRILSLDRPLSAQDFSLVQDLKAGIDANLNSPALLLSEKGAALMNAFKTSRSWLESNRVFQMIVRNATKGSFGENPQAFFRSMTQSVDDLSEIVSWELEVVDARVSAEKNAASRSFNLMLLSIVIVSIVLAAFSVFVIRAITGPVNRVITSLRGALATVSLGAGQLQHASHQVSSGSTEAASSMEETVASLEELSSMVNTNAENARNAANKSKISHESAQQGEGEIRNLISAMHEITVSSRKISEIISVIDDIAFQTNLLALNAAVEAARAGEQGKGFAVVSEAVRGLAQRSGTAAKEISSLIQESVAKTENGSQIADRSGAVLKEILASVNEVAQLNQEIASASIQQASGITQIGKAMTQLDQATQSNAASSEEVASFSQNLFTQSETLNRIVNELVVVVDGRVDEAELAAVPADEPGPRSAPDHLAA